MIKDLILFIFFNSFPFSKQYAKFIARTPPDLCQNLSCCQRWILLSFRHKRWVFSKYNILVVNWSLCKCRSNSLHMYVLRSNGSWTLFLMLSLYMRRNFLTHLGECVQLCDVLSSFSNTSHDIPKRTAHLALWCVPLIIRSSFPQMDDALKNPTVFRDCTGY